MTIHLFVCCHKPAIVPQNDIIKPIHVGKTLSPLNLNMQGDDTGDHISEKNPHFCELTATYWIWKNCHADIVGLFHYRRYLNFKTSDTKSFHVPADFTEKYGLTPACIQNALADCDLIVPRASKPTEVSVYDYYRNAHVVSDLDLVLDIIRDKYPDTYVAAEQALKNTSQMYLGNILIAKKEIFDLYAAWLFDILFAVEQKIQPEVLKRDAYQQRVYGFLAERMMGVFLATHPTLKVKTLPLLFVEENLKKWCRYCIRQWKRRILRLLGLRRK